MGKIIAVLNEKGGVAKTTTVKNLSIGLATQGKKVLDIDLDPSANLTTSLGFFNLPKEQITIMELFLAEENGEEFSDGMGILHHEEGIDLIPSKTQFHNHEAILQATMMKETVLRRILAKYQEAYDYIFIDCPAGLGIFVKNALFAADKLIIPVQPQFLGASAMMNLFDHIKDVRRLNGTGNKPEIGGILFTMVRMNTNNDTGLIREFHSLYDGKQKIFDTCIPNSVRFSESDGEGNSIYKYAPKSASAFVCGDLVKEFLKLEENK
ncbi:ParA family protein [[Clostridium] aminophilum]|uniref:ParA family protein n=1 Tax=[Clostridium] aminophilum TaxID=1526 RepID=UPI003F9C83B3